jgi:hypothetical protein
MNAGEDFGFNRGKTYAQIVVEALEEGLIMTDAQRSGHVSFWVHVRDVEAAILPLLWPIAVAEGFDAAAKMRDRGLQVQADRIIEDASRRIWEMIIIGDSISPEMYNADPDNYLDTNYGVARQDWREQLLRHVGGI